MADQGDLDWFDNARDEEAAPAQPQPERTGMAGLVRPPRTSDRPTQEAVERRRRIAVFGAVALAILIVVIVVVATSGGGGGGSPAPATTEPATQPTTTPAATGETGATGPTAPSIHVTIPTGGNLSSGDNGEQVKELQKALTQLNYYDGKVDGDFGTGTEAAVVAFQNDHNLKPDGIVGTDTADAINTALTSSGA